MKKNHLLSPPSGDKTISSVPEGTDETDPMASLRAKLKLADPEIQNYVAALETENLECARKVGKLQAENVTLKNRIAVLVEENKEQEGKAFAKLMNDTAIALGKVGGRGIPQNEDE